MNDELFKVPENLSPRLRWFSDVVRERRIFTHYTEGMGWLALSMRDACDCLSGYSLTQEEKSNGVALMFGYCSLLDEAGLVADCFGLEFDAAMELAIRGNWPLWTDANFGRAPMTQPLPGRDVQADRGEEGRSVSGLSPKTFSLAGNDPGE